MFKQFFEAFWPMAVDYVAEQGLSNILKIKDSMNNLDTLHKNLKLLSATAFDVEKEIKNGEDSGRKKRKREVEEWLGDVKSIETEVDDLGSKAESEGFIMRFLDGGKTTELNEQVEKLLQQRLNFGELVLDARGSRGETLLTDEMVGVAFKENLETILKILEDRQVSKIGVYGMGGVGKTTLAKHVYNRLMQENEGRVVWVTVSQEFTIKSLQDKIAHFIGVKLEDADEEAIRAARLDRFLSQKKISVLILDDVWEKIDMKKVGCTFAVECCRLIITTRSVEVCHRIGCKKLIPVVKLGRDEAWKLFIETLENETELGPQVEEIARSMAKVCDGLPLGIITVAGSMKGQKTIHTWRNALAEFKDCVGGQDETREVDEVFRVLKYSFNRLNRNCQSEGNEFNRFQLCFLYCSLYPEDNKIVREISVREFISEGLLDERKSWRAQVDQGHSILDKLVDVCLLESCVDRFGHKYLKMHDLIRSMALKICEGKYMVRAGERSLKEITNEEEWTKNLEKVSLVLCGIGSIKEGLSPDCPKLSTLLLWGNPELKVIPESLFFKMHGLCTLDLRGNIGIEILPDSISDLTSLKALLLEYCFKLEKVPYLGNLKAVRELNLSYTAIKEVPQGLEELHELRFLSMNASGLTKLFPKELLLKLGHLQHLYLPRHTLVEIEEINNLKQLEQFVGSVKNVSDFNRFIETSRVHDPCYSIGVKSDFDSEINYESAWEFHNNGLVLCECNLKDEKVLGKGVGDLTISDCEGLSKCFVDDLARFDNPTSLRKLKMESCRGIEWILRSDGQGSHVNTLQDINLIGLDDLKGVVVMERGGIGSSTAPTQPAVFSSLTRLEIFECNNMRKVGLPVSNVPNLEVIEVKSCGEIEEIFKEEDEGVATSILTLPKLTDLWLWDLPRVKRVSKATIICNSIETIHIRKCPRLMKKLPVHFDDPTPPFLREIKVDREWWESLEWDININPNFPQLLLPFVQFQDLPRSNPPRSLRFILVDREWWESLEWDINIHPNLPQFLQEFVDFKD